MKVQFLYEVDVNIMYLILDYIINNQNVTEQKVQIIILRDIALIKGVANNIDKNVACEYWSFSKNENI